MSSTPSPRSGAPKRDRSSLGSPLRDRSSVTHRGSIVEHSVEFSFGVHYGNGHIAYNSQSDTYDYMGPVVAGAALVSLRIRPASVTSIA